MGVCGFYDTWGGGDGIFKPDIQLSCQFGNIASCTRTCTCFRGGGGVSESGQEGPVARESC